MSVRPGWPTACGRLQIMAPALGEAIMYRVAAAYEAARNAEDGGPLIHRVPSLPASPSSTGVSL